MFSAFTIVRNEAILIAKHLIALAAQTRDVVCVVQPSTDATLLFARDVAMQLADFGCDIRVMPHEPETLGKEYSLAFALEQCRNAWCFNLDADETYVGAPISRLIDKLPGGAAAVSIPHWHAVAETESEYFKVEPFVPRLRLVNKTRLPKLEFALHQGLDQLLHLPEVAHLDRSAARILEYKTPSQHYADQLFYESQGCQINEADRCRERMSSGELNAGQSTFKSS